MLRVMKVSQSRHRVTASTCLARENHCISVAIEEQGLKVTPLWEQVCTSPHPPNTPTPAGSPSTLTFHSEPTPLSSQGIIFSSSWGQGQVFVKQQNNFIFYCSVYKVQALGERVVQNWQVCQNRENRADCSAEGILPFPRHLWGRLDSHTLTFLSGQDHVFFSSGEENSIQLSVSMRRDTYSPLAPKTRRIHTCGHTHTHTRSTSATSSLTISPLIQQIFLPLRSLLFKTIRWMCSRRSWRDYLWPF